MIETMNQSNKASPRANAALWALQILIAVAFAAAGAAKLAGAQMMVDIFAKIGFGQWFRILTGAVEISGAIFILSPRYSVYGALLLFFTMIGAIATHLLLIGGNPIPAFVLLALSGTVLWGRRKQLSA